MNTRNLNLAEIAFIVSVINFIIGVLQALARVEIDFVVRIMLVNQIIILLTIFVFGKLDLRGS